MQAQLSSKDAMVYFADRLATSEKFETLFQQGMELLHDASAYLDGEGRDAAKSLPPPLAAAYAAESMRLTTRMVQLASWLLLQRAVNKREMSMAEVLAEKQKLRFSQPVLVSDEATLARLPLPLVKFIETSLRLQARILHFDQLLYKMAELRGKDVRVRSPVANQMALLRAAFGFVQLEASGS